MNYVHSLKYSKPEKTKTSTLLKTKMHVSPVISFIVNCVFEVKKSMQVHSKFIC